MKTTQQHLDKFNANLIEVKNKLGLTGWKIPPARIRSISPAIAHVAMLNGDQLAKVSLGRHGSEDELSDEGLMDSATHEMLHLMLNDFAKVVTAKVLAQNTVILAGGDDPDDPVVFLAARSAMAVAECQVDAEEHRIINRLMSWKK